MYVRARDAGHREWVAEAKQFSDFYVGKQWREQDILRLEAEGRPALTINMILSTVNVLLGEQSLRRADFQFKPRRGGTEESAHALTKLAMAIGDANKYDWVESQVFSDGVIEDRGYFELRMNFDERIEGDLEIKSLDPRLVIPDPDAKSSDPQEWKEVFITRWWSLDDIAREYGDEKARELEIVGLSGQHYDRDSMDIVVGDRFGETTLDTSAEGVQIDEEARAFVRSVRIIDRQYWRNTRVFVLVDPTTGDQRELPVGWKKKEAERFAQQLGLAVYPKTVRKVYWRVTADRVVLHDDWSPYRTFTVIPYFPFFRRGKPFGLVRNLLSPQEQLNKTSSQELHIVNTTANSGWIVERGSLSGMTADELAASGSKTGLVIEYNPGRNPPDKIKPNTVPTGIERLGAKAHNFIREISGISKAMLGVEKAEVSGVALREQKNAGAIQVQVPMDSLAHTRFMVARKILELIQDYYTDERIITITQDLEPGQPVEDLVINGQGPDGEIINDVTTGEYDIVIGTMPHRDAFDDVQFAEALNLREAGVMIPDHHVILYSHLAQKHKIAAEVQQMAGLGPKSEEQIEQEQMLTQIQIATLQAELAKLEAQAMELQSKAELNMARTGEIADGSEAQLRELEMKMAKTREEIGLRERLAELSAINKLDLAAIQRTNRPPVNS